MLDYEERRGAKLHWVISNKKGCVCVEQSKSVDLFRLMAEHNEGRARVI